MAANENALGALHEKVATVLSQLLDGTELPTGEVDEDTGEAIVQTMAPSAAIITSAIQFLKNNSITCAPAEDNALGALKDKLERRDKKRLAKADFEAADEVRRFAMPTEAELAMRQERPN